MGGLLDEKKSDIYKILPTHLVPKTWLINDRDFAFELLKRHSFTYPLILKPDIGFRGYEVSKIVRDDQLKSVVENLDMNRGWLIQEFIQYHGEFSLLYYQLPATGTYGVTSLIEKKYPKVVGDGHSTLRQLIDEDKNPFLDREKINDILFDQLEEVIPESEEVVLDEIGNYSRGAKFYDMSQNISKPLLVATHSFFGALHGLNLFRVDFKANNLEDYCQGKFMVIEINGAKSEPLHIYDPKYSFFDNCKTIHQHWITIGKIIREKNKLGDNRFPPFREGLKAIFAIKKLVK